MDIHDTIRSIICRSLSIRYMVVDETSISFTMYVRGPLGALGRVTIGSRYVYIHTYFDSRRDFQVSIADPDLVSKIAEGIKNLELRKTELRESQRLVDPPKSRAFGASG